MGLLWSIEQSNSTANKVTQIPVLPLKKYVPELLSRIQNHVVEFPTVVANIGGESSSKFDGGEGGLKSKHGRSMGRA